MNWVEPLYKGSFQLESGVLEKPCITRPQSESFATIQVRSWTPACGFDTHWPLDSVYDVLCHGSIYCRVTNCCYLIGIYIYIYEPASDAPIWFHLNPVTKNKMAHSLLVLEDNWNQHASNETFPGPMGLQTSWTVVRLKRFRHPAQSLETGHSSFFDGWAVSAKTTREDFNIEVGREI